MSAKQKHPGTTTPTDRIVAKIDERLNNIGKDKEKDPNRKTGSKYGKNKLKNHKGRVRKARTDPRPKLQRRQGSRIDFREGVVMDVINAVRYILENHGRKIDEVVSGYNNKELLSKMARKCMSTCLSGWQEAEHGLISDNTDLVLSRNSWEITEEGTARLRNGFKFDYDWLYDLSNAQLITEDIDETALDKDSFSDALSNAANLLRKLSDKEVKKYILNAAKEDEDVDLMNLKEVLEDTGVNWKFIGAEISGDKVNLLVRVRYTKDGTQEGVIEKKLSIEVKPGADVRDATSGDETSDKEVNLAFPGGESEGDIERPIMSNLKEKEDLPEPEDIDAGLDLGVNL